MSTKLRGEVAFPLAGEGCFIHFSALEVAELEEIHGVGDYFDAIERGVNHASGKIITQCLGIGLKRRMADGRRERVQLDYEAVDWPFADAGLPILDALCLSSAGKTYAEVIQEAIDREAKIRAEIEKASKGGADDGAPDPSKASEAFNELRQSVSP